MMRRLLTYRFILLLLICGISSIAFSAENEDRFRNKVNLALRQAAHNLLLIEGDSSSKIPPVKYEESGAFSLIIESGFNYDTLPQLLEKAFSDFDIDKAYQVQILDCEDGKIFLGFNKPTPESGSSACQGRDITAQCANIQVLFESDDSTAFGQLNTFPKWLVLPIFASMLLLLYYQYSRVVKHQQNDGRLKLGLYAYDPNNQILFDGENKTNLTFRENKLLQLFATQPNKVLTRSEIMETVWEDEGVIVGRSLDVFISRLRKLLNKDPNIQIKNVHGVGYRLESSS